MRIKKIRLAAVFVAFVAGALVSFVCFVPSEKEYEKILSRRISQYSTDQARGFAKYLFGDYAFRHGQLMQHLNLVIEVWMYCCLSDWANDESLRGDAYRAADIFALYLSKPGNKEYFLKTYPVSPEMEKRLNLMQEAGNGLLKKEMEESSQNSVSGEKMRILFNLGVPLFSYEDFVYSSNQQLEAEQYFDDEEDLSDPMPSAEALTQDLYAHFSATGYSSADEAGGYHLYFIIPENRVIDCPMGADNRLCSPISIKKFSQIVISSNGRWSISEN